MTYGIRMSWNNFEQQFDLPVNPSEIEISESGNSKTYDVIGQGEINVIQNQKLPEYAFKGFFPNPGKRAANVYAGENATGIYDPFISSAELLEPRQYVAYILDWMRSNRPIRFEFTGEMFSINTPASIEKFDWKEVAGSGGDIEYSLSLKKYIFYSPKKVTIAAEGTVSKSAGTRPNDKLPPKTYTMKAGDSLWKVAKLLLGSGDRWREIQKLNAITDAQVRSLPIGKVLRIPEGAAAHA